MGFKETALEMKAGFEAQLARNAEVMTEIHSKVEAMDAMLLAYEADLKIAEAKGFEAGLAQAGQAGGSDKIYSDAELNAELAPLKEKVTALEQKLGVVELLVATKQGEVEVLKSEVAQEKAKLLEAVAQFKAAQIDDAAVISKFEI